MRTPISQYFLFVLVLRRFAGTLATPQWQGFPDVVEYEYHFVEHEQEHDWE